MLESNASSIEGLDAYETWDEDEQEALAARFNQDGSRLTSSQRLIIHRTHFARFLPSFDLPPLQYWEGRMPCVSVADTEWPIFSAFAEVKNLKKWYINGEDLAERLKKLKPSENYELKASYIYPASSVTDSPWRIIDGFDFYAAPAHDYHKDMWRLTELSNATNSSKHRRTFDRCVEDIQSRFERLVEEAQQLISPFPTLRLLQDVERTPGGTQYPEPLVRGLSAIRERVEDERRSIAEPFQEQAKIDRDKVISTWNESEVNPRRHLTLYVPYRYWPAEVMDKIDTIDRNAIVAAWETLIVRLVDVEPDMSELVTFYTGTNLVPERPSQHLSTESNKLPPDHIISGPSSIITSQIGIVVKPTDVQAAKPSSSELSTNPPSIRRDAMAELPATGKKRTFDEIFESQADSRSTWLRRLRPKKNEGSRHSPTANYVTAAIEREPKGEVEQHWKKGS